MSFLNRLQFERGPSATSGMRLTTIRLIGNELAEIRTDPTRRAEGSDLEYMLDKVKEDQAHLAPRDTAFT